MEIRETQIKDLEQLAWLYRQSYNGDTGVITDIEKIKNKFNYLLSDENYKFFSCLQGDKVIGYCSIVINQVIFGEQKPLIMVWHLRVDPSFRKQSVGTKLLEFVEKFGKSINADYVCLLTDSDNYGAHEFYKKNKYLECPSYYKYL